MKKLFKSYHSWIRILSVLCVLLFPVAELLAPGDERAVIPALLVSEIGGSAMLLVLPLPDEEARSAFFCALFLMLMMTVCHFVGALPEATVAALMTAVLLHLVRMFRQRYSRLRPVLRIQAAWYALESQLRLLGSLMLCVLAVIGMAVLPLRWLRIPAAVALALFYLLQLRSSRNGRIYLLEAEKEKALRRMMNSGTAGAAAEPTADAVQMRDLFAKVVSVMESSRPYLDEDFSMQELSMMLYTNKTTLSRAINLMSGTNFRQFINSYRIRHSVELLKKNPRLRVDELSEMSGFHSPVTFTMAFKANMHETPGEYSQRLRSNLP